MKSWKREARVAGSFYPSDKQDLLEVLGGLLPEVPTPTRCHGLVVPHAGYVYSGRIAGEVYAQTEVPDTVVILCPNHTGYGKRVALWSEGEWETPLGPVPVDREFSEALLASGAFFSNQDAHLAEHAIETHLPFLVARNPNVHIVPVVLGRMDWDACQGLAKILADCLEEHPALLVASTDMSHYVSAGDAKKKDDLALEAVCALDGAALVDVVRRESISMCGYIPTAVVLEAARRRGAQRGDVLAYGHSGEVLGSDAQVVAYAGARIS